MTNNKNNWRPPTLPVFSRGPGCCWAGDHHWGIRLWRARQPAASSPLDHPGAPPRPHYAPGAVRGPRQDREERQELQETEQQKVTISAQLRFERHPSVHKLFLNMWGEQKNHSRHTDNAKRFCKRSCYKKKSCYAAHPTSFVSGCTHRSLSNLSCWSETQREMLTVMLAGHGSRAGESETGGGWCLCKSQVRIWWWYDRHDASSPDSRRHVMARVKL